MTNDPTRPFRTQLHRRFLGLVSTGLLVPVLLAGSACTSKVTVHGGAGGQGGAGEGGTGDGGYPVPPTTSTSVDPNPDPGLRKVCAKVPLATSVVDCPSIDDDQAVHDLIGDQLLGCGYDFNGKAEFDRDTSSCCYLIYEYGCTSGLTGRPYTVQGEAQRADAMERGSWTAGNVAEPMVDDLSPEARQALADAWTRDALMEHASVASFGRFALELMALGAPAELLAAAHAAAIDEVKHAAECFKLASAYAGHAIGPDRFDFEGQVSVEKDIAAIARATFEEGCINETWASVLAAEQLVLARDPAVKQVLATICEDEARHAELAWRSIRWMLEVGGTSVRGALEEAVADLERRLAEPGEAAPEEPAELRDTLLAHGRIGARVQEACYRDSMVEVVLPCVKALLLGDEAIRSPSPAVASV